MREFIGMNPPHLKEYTLYGVMVLKVKGSLYEILRVFINRNGCIFHNILMELCIKCVFISVGLPVNINHCFCKLRMTSLYPHREWVHLSRAAMLGHAKVAHNGQTSREHLPHVIFLQAAA